MMQIPSTPVLIVGAGPVGLTLACELARQGISFRIIDAGEGPTPPHESRALGIHARTLEVFDALGVIEPILQQGRPIHGVHVHNQGRPFARVQFDFDDLHTHYPFVLSLSQGDTERHLMDSLTQAGRPVEWNNKLTAFRQDEAGITAEITTGNEQSAEIQADWLIGCDGARSRVRECLGLSFEGFSYPERFLLADTAMNWDMPENEAQLFLVQGGLMPTIPLPGAGMWRLIDATGATEEEDPNAIAEKFRRLLAEGGFPAEVMQDPHWVSAFQIHRRMVDRLRVGRCFLAGDAAHIHSPVGGQGMNTGIQEAFNLGWKLALVIEKIAAEQLLDSYPAERLPIASAVETATHWATRFVTLRNPLLRWLRNRVMKTLAGSRTFRRNLTWQLSELGVHYRSSPIVGEDWKAKSSPTPRPGERVPDVPLSSPSSQSTRLHEFLRGPGHTLLLFSGKKTSDGPENAPAEVLQIAQGILRERVSLYQIAPPGQTEFPPSPEATGILDPEGRLHAHFGATEKALYLIRPDGHVAYRSQPANPQKLEHYLRQVFASSTGQDR